MTFSLSEIFHYQLWQILWLPILISFVLRWTFSPNKELFE